jgi:hypothetical protein
MVYHRVDWGITMGGPRSEAVLLEELKFDGVWTLPRMPLSSDENNKI